MSEDSIFPALLPTTVSEDRLERIMLSGRRANNGKKFPQIVAALSASLGSLAMGVVMGWSAAIGSLGMSNWIISVVNIGAALICLQTYKMLRTIGTKKTMMYLVVPFTIGWVLILMARYGKGDLLTLFVARFLLGIGGGAFCVTVPIYTAEIAEKEIRGTLGKFFQVMAVTGNLFAYSLGLIVYDSSFYFNMFCGLVPVIFAVIFIFMPETPFYLVSKNKMNEAKASLRWLRGEMYDERPELQMIVEESENMEAENLSFSEAFSHPAAKNGLIIAFGLMFFQQMSGINAVIFYATDILRNNASLGIVIVGSIQVIVTVLAILLIDKFGRRTMLIFSSSLMAISTIFLGTYYIIDENSDLFNSVGFIPLITLSVFIGAHSIGYGPIPYLMIDEMFEPNVKNYALSLAYSVNWGLAFFVTFVFPELIDALGRGPIFCVFGVFSVLATRFVYYIVPETLSVPLNEIQNLLHSQHLPNVREFFMGAETTGIRVSNLLLAAESPGDDLSQKDEGIYKITMTSYKRID